MTKDKLVSNTRNQDGDIIFQVNKAGVKTEVMRVDGGTGNVGIGTVSPTFRLEVRGGTSSNSSTDSSASIIRVYNPNSNYPNFPNTGAAVELIGGYNPGVGARIMAQQVADEYSQVGLNFQISTAPNVWVTKMYLDGASGNIGIGTTSPSGASGVAFEINGKGSQARLTIKNDATGAAATDGFQIAVDTAADVYLEQRENRSMVFSTNAIERMRIDSSGNVGIGTTSPTRKLHVNGAMNISDGNVDRFVVSYGVSGASLNNNDNSPIILATNNAEKIRVDVAGNLLVGSTSPIDAVKRIHAENNSTDGQYSARSTTTTAGKYWKFGATNNAYIVYNQGNTGVYMNDGATSWTANSDERTKKNIKPLELGLAEIEALKPSCFDYKTDDSEDSKRVGFIAQEVLSILPHAVYAPENPEDMMGVSMTEMIPVLVKAIQELKAELDLVKSKLPN